MQPKLTAIRGFSGAIWLSGAGLAREDGGAGCVATCTASVEHGRTGSGAGCFSPVHHLEVFEHEQVDRDRNIYDARSAPLRDQLTPAGILRVARGIHLGLGPVTHCRAPPQNSRSALSRHGAAASTLPLHSPPARAGQYWRSRSRPLQGVDPARAGRAARWRPQAPCSTKDDSCLANWADDERMTWRGLRVGHVKRDMRFGFLPHLAVVGTQKLGTLLSAASCAMARAKTPRQPHDSGPRWSAKTSTQAACTRLATFRQILTSTVNRRPAHLKESPACSPNQR